MLFYVRVPVAREPKKDKEEVECTVYPNLYQRTSLASPDQTRHTSCFYGGVYLRAMDCNYKVAHLVELLCYKSEGCGFNPDEVPGFFKLPTPFSNSMTLGSTQPLADMSTGHFPWGKGWPTREARNHTAICELIV
jgi:hypothetical protein